MRNQGMFLVLALFLTSTAVLAEDLRGTDELLCTAVQASRCSMDDDCWSGNPWDWNIPQFIEIDLKKMQLSTTAASPEDRKTAIKNLERKDGMIYLQGVEGGRAFSFAIDEAGGSLSVAVATKASMTIVLGACTPRLAGE